MIDMDMKKAKTRMVNIRSAVIFGSDNREKAMAVTGPILTEKARLLFPSTDSFHLHVSEQIHLLLKYMYTCTIINKGVWITLCITTLSDNFKSILVL